MKKLTFFSALLTGILLAGCSTVKVTVDMDKTVDFSQYETYSFLGWQKNSDQIMNEFDKKRMHDAFMAEFKKRGLEYVASGGDMSVTLYLVVSKETSVTAYTNYYGMGGYGRYNRYGYGWGGSSTTSYSENDYLKGTLVMDVFDEKSGDQIWQGIATGTVSDQPEKREKSIPKNVGTLMSKFPVQPVN
ncbi:MAG: DUF4136 domain-containing protein [Bacteroidota bacterium]